MLGMLVVACSIDQENQGEPEIPGELVLEDIEEEEIIPIPLPSLNPHFDDNGELICDCQENDGTMISIVDADVSYRVNNVLIEDTIISGRSSQEFVKWFRENASAGDTVIIENPVFRTENDTNLWIMDWPKFVIIKGA
ncbi:MAG: hypothetical protein COB88_04760 [Flavobacteriales bacterium]|nr:MAG: hypothetical protein COB88_04760 [Flavobacteriales bacterium]